MNRFEKLFLKLSWKERVLLEECIAAILDPERHREIDVKKLRGSNFYRARKRHFRIIFHFESGEAVIDDIRLRGGRTYKDF